jgi:glutamyl-tRNA synthetase
MVDQFSLERVSLGGPVFDLTKLGWLNGRWIREDLDDQHFAARVRRWALNEEYVMQLVPLVRSRVSVLSDLGPLAAPFFSGIVAISLGQLLEGKLDRSIICRALQLALLRIESLEWNKAAIEEMFKGIATELGVKLRDCLRPFFVVMSGSPVSVPLYDAMQILGRDLCRARLRHALELVGEKT